MQRVRVGLTGLAFVFLLVMLATAFLGFGRESDPAQANLAAAAQTANAADSAPREPLAELGVAPGNSPPASSPESGAATRR